LKKTKIKSIRAMSAIALAPVVAASIILPARTTPPSGVSVTPLAPVAQFNEINANATDGGNGLPVITNLPTATNPYTNFSTGG
jgi:hypothetical protein